MYMAMRKVVTTVYCGNRLGQCVISLCMPDQATSLHSKDEMG